jgi:hypothetical protein
MELFFLVIKFKCNIVRWISRRLSPIYVYSIHLYPALYDIGFRCDVAVHTAVSSSAAVCSSAAECGRAAVCGSAAMCGNACGSVVVCALVKGLVLRM